MECPTCFRKIVVPQAPTSADPKLLLTAAQVPSRPATKIPADWSLPGRRGVSRRTKRVFGLALLGLACAAAGAVLVMRDVIFKRSDEFSRGTNSSSLRVCRETNWTLKLADRRFPDSRAVGRINGREFALEKATVQGGLLVLRQGPKWPPDLGVAIHLFARRGEDLAGQSINIDPSRTNAPKVILYWKDDQELPVTHTVHDGYALRLEFGPVTGGMLPGKVLLCAPDDAKSWVAGTFEAELRKPPVAKPPNPPQPTAPRGAKP
jgi:hypothetical protein